MISERDWQFASKNVPLELHIELIKLCYGFKLWTEFENLLDPALVRLKFRRYEVPYLATVDVSMSGSKISNVPNGFEKLTKDLNAANLRIELKKLRASSKKGDGGPQPPAKKEEKKEERKKTKRKHHPPSQIQRTKKEPKRAKRKRRKKSLKLKRAKT